MAPSESDIANAESKKIVLNSYVGFDSIADQIHRKLKKRGFNFNLMVVGRAGLGKSTLVNTLFCSHQVDSKGVSLSKTTEISTVSAIIEEKGVNLRLSITDTPGFGDLVNNEDCVKPIEKFIKEQYSMYLRKELTPQRDLLGINDTRIHCLLYVIAPTGHSLTPLDITVLKRLGKICNVVPVVGKSDSLTLSERKAFKERIKDELIFHGIRTYPFAEPDTDVLADGSTDQLNAKRHYDSSKEMIPFMVSGSESKVVVDGKAVAARRTRFGVVNVEDPQHSEFTQMRNFLIRTSLHDMIETTSSIHYETFRSRQLMALKEQTTSSSKAAD